MAWRFYSILGNLFCIAIMVSNWSQIMADSQPVAGWKVAYAIVCVVLVSTLVWATVIETAGIWKKPR